MSNYPIFNFKPDPENFLQVSFADFYSQIFPNGGTQSQFTCMYGSFVAGMVCSINLMNNDVKAERLLEQIKKEGIVVTEMMEKFDKRKGIIDGRLGSGLSGDVRQN
jgi:hypothetical protein